MKKKLLALLVIFAVVLSFGSSAYAGGTAYGGSAGGGGGNTNGSAIVVGVGASTAIPNNGDITTWSSSNTAVATVDGNGNVSGVSLGIVSITGISSSGAYTVWPTHVALRGIDVSSHQNAIDWSQVAASGRVNFAIIRTGFGWMEPSTQKDKYFEANYSGATANGIKVGAYHYSYATTVAAAREEAEFCLSILNGRKLDYPVYYDLEDKAQRGLSASALADIVDAFCGRIKDAGYQTGIYSSPSWFRSLLSDPRISNYDIWLAHWGTDGISSFTGKYNMWQYGYENIPGAGSQIDANYSYRDYSAAGGGGVAGGGGNTGPVTPPDDNNNNNNNTNYKAIVSDTNGAYSFNQYSAYTYKITTDNPNIPTAASDDTNVATVAYDKKVGDGYLFKITNRGPGQTTVYTADTQGNILSLTVNGKTATAPPPPVVNNGVKSDTTVMFSLKQGNSYTFKFTVNGTGTPSVGCGSGYAQTTKMVKLNNNEYLCTVKGMSKGDVGIYAGSTSANLARVCIIRVV